MQDEEIQGESIFETETRKGGCFGGVVREVQGIVYSCPNPTVSLER